MENQTYQEGCAMAPPMQASSPVAPGEGGGGAEQNRLGLGGESATGEIKSSVQPGPGPEAALGAPQAMGAPGPAMSEAAFPQVGPQGYVGPQGNVGPQGQASPQTASGPVQDGKGGPMNKEGHACGCSGHAQAPGPQFGSQYGPQYETPYGVPYPFSGMFGPQFGFAPQPMYGPQPGMNQTPAPGFVPPPVTPPSGVQYVYGPNPGMNQAPPPGFGPQPVMSPAGAQPIYGPQPGAVPSAGPEFAMPHGAEGGCGGMKGGFAGQPGFGAPNGFAGFPGFGGVPGFGAPSAQYGPGDPRLMDNQYGQLMAMCSDLMQGKADPMKIASFLTSSGTHFWKGAIVGAALTFILTNDGVKSALAESFSGIFGSKASETE